MRTLLILLLTCTASGATYYLDNTASGANDGSSPTDAWESVSDALTGLDALGDNGSGDTVEVAAGSGSYGDWEDSMVRTDWLTIKPYTGETAEIKSVYLNASGSSYTKFEDMYIHQTDTTANASGQAYILNVDCNDVTFDGCDVHGYDRYRPIAPYLSGDNLSVLSCEIRFDEVVGQYASETRGLNIEGTNFLVQGCYIHDFAASGIRVSSPSTGSIIGNHISNSHAYWTNYAGGSLKHGSGFAMHSGNIKIYRNVVHAVGSSALIGFYATGWGVSGSIPVDGIEIVNNLFYDFKNGITTYTAGADTCRIRDDWKIINNTFVCDWDDPTPVTPDNTQRYEKPFFSLDWHASYSNDLQMYNNLIIGAVEGFTLGARTFQQGNNIMYSYDDDTMNWDGRYVLDPNESVLSYGSGTGSWHYKLPETGWDPELDIFEEGTITDLYDYTYLTDVDDVNQADDYFMTTGSDQNWSDLFSGKSTVTIIDSTGNDDTYTVSSYNWDTAPAPDEFKIYVTEEIPSAVADGDIVLYGDNMRRSVYDFRLKSGSQAIDYGDFTKCVAEGGVYKSLGTLDGSNEFLLDNGVIRTSGNTSAGAYEEGTPVSGSTIFRFPDYKGVGL